MEDPKKISPKVVVFDVENEMMNEDLVKELYEKNLKNAGVSEDEFKERVNRTNRKGMTVGNVIEISNRMRDVLVSESRVYVKWRACKRVKEFVNVLKCHKCFAFGHVMRECSVDGRLCESGHLKEKYKSASLCQNCRMKGKKCDHSVLSTECPEYVRMLERESATIRTSLNILQLNCQRSYAVLNDLSAVLVDEKVNVARVVLYVNRSLASSIDARRK